MRRNIFCITVLFLSGICYVSNRHKKLTPYGVSFSVSKNHVIASQCAHWRGNPYPLQGGALRVPSAHRRPFGVVSLYERQREQIATPACGLVRDDIYILGFLYSLKLTPYGVSFLFCSNGSGILISFGKITKNQPLFSSAGATKKCGCFLQDTRKRFILYIISLCPA